MQQLKGIWQGVTQMSQSITTQQRFPQKNLQFKMGKNPVHLEYADGIGEKEIKGPP